MSFRAAVVDSLLKSSVTILAQGSDCLERLFAKIGGWEVNKHVQRILGFVRAIDNIGVLDEVSDIVAGSAGVDSMKRRGGISTVPGEQPMQNDLYNSIAHHLLL